MKGISPFIAVVLLIAFTVAVGGILAVWFSTITTSQTATVQSSSDALAKCSSTSISISDVRFNSSATAAKIVNVTLSSAGNQNLKNLTITVTGLGASSTSIKYFNATGDDLLPGGAFATSVNVTGGAAIPPEQVIVNALCQGQYAISNVCKSGDSCMKPV